VSVIEIELLPLEAGRGLRCRVVTPLRPKNCRFP